MVDEMTNETYQTAKTIATVSIDLVKMIAESLLKALEKNMNLSENQQKSVIGKMVDSVTKNYKQTHGSLKEFNKSGAEVAHLDVSDERTAEIIRKTCKKNHIPVDIKETPRADGTSSYMAFCEVKNVDQLAAILKMSSEKVVEEQKAVTKEVVLYNEADQPIMSQGFVRDSDIDFNKISEVSDSASRFEIRDSASNVVDSGIITPGEDVSGKVKEKAQKLNPKQKKSLKETISAKRTQIEKKDKNRQREKTKQKIKTQSRLR